MKKIINFIAFFCAAVFVCMCAEAKEYEADAQQNAIDMLYELGFIDNDKFGNFPADVSATRMEFFVAIARIIGINGDESFKGCFSDIDKETAGAALIEGLYEAGYIHGYEDGSFHPNDYIKSSDAVRIVISILNYDRYIQRSGDYLGTAKKLNLTTAVGSGEYLTKGSMAHLLKNALDVPMLDIKPISATDSRMEEGETLLKKYHEIETVEGVLNSDAHCKLVDSVSATQGYASIGNLSLKCEIDNVSELLGYYVKGYYNSNKNILLWVEAQRKNDITYLTDENKPYYKDGSIVYSDESGNTGRISVPSTAKIVYNGKLITSFDSNKFKVKNGDIRVISNDGDRTADVIVINSYESYIVDMLDYDNGVLYIKNSSTGVLNFALADYAFYDENGKELDWSYVTEWSVLDTVISDDKSVMKFYKSSNVKELYITAIDEDYVIDADGNRYKLVDSYTTHYGKIMVGEKGQYFLNKLGKICGKYQIRNKNGEIAYLLSYTYKSSKDEMIVRFADEMSSTTHMEKKIVLKDKIRIDGKKYKLEEMEDAFYDIISNDKYRVCLLYYDDDGTLKEIDTAKLGDNEDKNNTLCVDYTADSDLLYRESAGSFGGKTIVEKDFMVLMVSPHTAGANISNDAVDIRPGTKCLATGEKYTNFTTYKMGKDSFICQYLLYNKAVGTRYGTYGRDMFLTIITNIAQVYDEENDEIKNLVTYYHEGIKGESYLSDAVAANELAKGDIVKLSLDANGEINDFRKMFSGTTLKPWQGVEYTDSTGKAYVVYEEITDGSLSGTKGIDDIERAVYGNVYDIRDGVVLITKEDPSTLAYLSESDLLNYCEKHRLPTLIGKYTKGGNKEEIYKPSGQKEIRSYVKNGNSYSKLFLYSVYSNVKEGYIIIDE